MTKKDFDIRVESTWLNPQTKSRKDIIEWILTNMGFPIVTVELTESQLNVAVQDALEKYTKYATYEDTDIMVDLFGYDREKGLDLSEYNIASITDIAFRRDSLLYGYGNDFFFGLPALMNSYAGAGIFPFMNHVGSANGSWVSLHNLHENIELINRMTGSMPQYRYHKATKRLVLTPAPHPDHQPAPILITCQIEPDPTELYGNEYVKRLALARAKMILGTVRRKFQNTPLLGGGTIDTEIGTEGKEEWDKLVEEIQTNESYGNIAIIG
jgi:hypothetical protein